MTPGIEPGARVAVADGRKTVEFVVNAVWNAGARRLLLAGDGERQAILLSGDLGTDGKAEILAGPFDKQGCEAMARQILAGREIRGSITAQLLVLAAALVVSAFPPDATQEGGQP